MKEVSYASSVGSLMCIMVYIRPDIMQAVGTVSKFLANSRKELWGAVKWIMRYLRGTTNASLYFSVGSQELVCYNDASWAGDIVTRRSTSGLLVTFVRGGYILIFETT